MQTIKTILLAAVMLAVFVMMLPVMAIVLAVSFWRMRQLARQFNSALGKHYNQAAGDTEQGECIDGEYKVIRE